MTVEELMDWLRRSDGRIEDIFGLWVQGKRDDRWVAEKLIAEGHIAALSSAATPSPDAGEVERLQRQLEREQHNLELCAEEADRLRRIEAVAWRVVQRPYDKSRWPALRAALEDQPRLTETE